MPLFSSDRRLADSSGFGLAIAIALLTVSGCDHAHPDSPTARSTADSMSQDGASGVLQCVLSEREWVLIRKISDHSASKLQDGNQVLVLGRELGYVGTPHPLRDVFDELAVNENADCILESLLANEDEHLVARLYALALMKDLRSERFRHWADAMSLDERAFLIASGCEPYARVCYPIDFVRSVTSTRNEIFAPGE